MRFFSILTALLVTFSLYLLVFERPALLAFAQGGDAPQPAPADTPDAAETPEGVGVVAIASRAREIEQVVLMRGQTEAARAVDVAAETSGEVISDPLRKGAHVAAGDLLCRIAPGTREINLAEAEARLAEARSRVPEAEARLAEALAAVPAARAHIVEAEARVPEAEARLNEAKANIPAAEARLREARARVPEAEARLAEARAKVPEAEARLAEALANIPAMESRLTEAMARLPEAEARVVEANARVAEAEINLNAATELAKGGFAAKTRVAAARAAADSAAAGVETAKSQLQGAKAGVEAAKGAIEGAKAGVQAAKSMVEGALAGIQSAKSLVENASAGVETAKSAVQGAHAAVQSARSQVESASAGVMSAKSQLEGALAGVQSAKSGVESAKSAIQSAEAGVAAAKKEIERLEIRAPFAGLLETDAAELGSLLQPGAPCATVIQLDPIKLVGFVPETDIDKVRPEAPARARLATGRAVNGVVRFIGRSADPATRTFRVEVEVANGDLAIRDGQTVEIAVQSESARAYLVPQSALTLDDEGTLGVRVVEPDSTAGFRPVTVLRDTVDGIFVAGLPDHADIVVVGQEFVTDGVALRPTFRSPTEAGVSQ